MATHTGLTNSGSQDRTDLVAYWSVPLLDGVHTVEFEHGTTSGKRVLRVDGQEIIRREWMFKLVGDEQFYLGKQHARCVLRVDPMPHFSFSYSLYVDGKPLQKFTERQSKSMRSWAVIANGVRYRIVFEKQTLNVYVNGNLVQAESVFSEDGTEMRFEVGNQMYIIQATGADKKQGIIHELFVDGRKIEADFS